VKRTATRDDEEHRLDRRGEILDAHDVHGVIELSTAIEPVLLIILGVAVLFTALAVFLPSGTS